MCIHSQLKLSLRWHWQSRPSCKMGRTEDALSKVTLHLALALPILKPYFDRQLWAGWCWLWLAPNLLSVHHKFHPAVSTGGKQSGMRAPGKNNEILHLFAVSQKSIHFLWHKWVFTLTRTEIFHLLITMSHPRRMSNSVVPIFRSLWIT